MSKPVDCQTALPYNLSHDVLRDHLLNNCLDDRELIMACNQCNHSREICNQDDFWRDRLGLTNNQLLIVDQYRNNRRWSRYYIEDLRHTINNPNDVLLDAAESNRLDIVIIALERPNRYPNAPVPQLEQSALIKASDMGHLDIVNYLQSKIQYPI